MYWKMIQQKLNGEITFVFDSSNPKASKFI